MKTRFFYLGMMLSVISLTACNANETADELNSQVSTIETDESDSPMGVSAFTSLPESLTQGDVDGLMLMREEEGLARDVYLYFYAKYKYRIFSNIAASEKVHTTAVLSLINYFKLTDPATGKPGEYSSPEIAALYSTLTAQGNTIENALATGAFIEEYDINNLKNLIASTENADLKKVYGNLLRASGFHLKSFTAMLKFKGIVYAPKILSAEEYASIIKK